MWPCSYWRGIPRGVYSTPTASTAPFTQDVDGEDEIPLWPDLASAHYAKATVALNEELSINFVPRHCNPSNLPQLWRNEKFWDILKQLLYKDGWEAKTASADQLQRRVKKCLSKIVWSAVRAMMGSVKSAIRRSEDETPLALL